jgi:hypothetical protein
MNLQLGPREGFILSRWLDLRLALSESASGCVGGGGKKVSCRDRVMRQKHREELHT